MSLAQIFKKVLIPCAAGVTNAASSENHTYGPNCVKKPQTGTKPSDLPIYSKECVTCRESNQPSPPPSSMEETVGNIRKELWVWQDNLKGYRHKIVDVYRKGFSKADCPAKKESRNHLDGCFEEKKKSCEEVATAPAPAPKFEKLCLDRCGRPCSGEHKHHFGCQTKPQPPSPEPCQKSQSAGEKARGAKVSPSDSVSETVVDHLRQPANGSHRIGAIAISGLAGYILGMRRGKFRRVLYGTMGALGMAAICYPEEAADVLESVVLEGRKYFIVAYHFVYGESPQAPEWLEKFIGPLGSKESKTSDSSSDAKATNAIQSKENPSEKKKA